MSRASCEWFDSLPSICVLLECVPWPRNFCMCSTGSSNRLVEGLRERKTVTRERHRGRKADGARENSDQKGGLGCGKSVGLTSRSVLYGRDHRAAERWVAGEGERNEAGQCVEGVFASSPSGPPLFSPCVSLQEALLLPCYDLCQARSLVSLLAFRTRMARRLQIFFCLLAGSPCEVSLYAVQSL